MNDQKYIRKAVELAKGWILETSWHYPPDVRFGDLAFRLNPSSRYYQLMLDALAAQLVRQVEDKGWNVLVQYCNVSVSKWGEPPAIDADYETNDRTMNTIKAIVDSGVLRGRGQ